MMVVDDGKSPTLPRRELSPESRRDHVGTIDSEGKDEQRM